MRVCAEVSSSKSLNTGDAHPIFVSQTQTLTPKHTCAYTHTYTCTYAHTHTCATAPARECACTDVCHPAQRHTALSRMHLLSHTHSHTAQSRTCFPSLTHSLTSRHSPILIFSFCPLAIPFPHTHVGDRGSRVNQNRTFCEQ